MNSSTAGSFIYSMVCDYHHSLDSPYHPYGKLSMEITLDDKSMRAYHEWMADGSVGNLIITRSGITYSKE